MNWKKSTPKEKIEWLEKQLEEIRKTRNLLRRFESLTQKWIKKVQKAK